MCASVRPDNRGLDQAHFHDLQRYCHEFDFRWTYRIATGYNGIRRGRVR